MTNYVIKDDKVYFHPGFYIAEYIEDTGITKEALAAELGITASALEKLVNGDMELTEDMAEKLEVAVGGSKEYWIRMWRGFTISEKN